MSLEGRKIRAQGKLKKIKRSVADQKHFLKDEGKSQKEIDQITKDVVIYEFEAASVATIN